MSFLRNISIKRKLTAIIMLTSGIVLFLASVAFVTNDLVAFRRQMMEDLSILAKIIEINSTAALVFNDRKAGAETLAALRAEANIMTACIHMKNGSLFAGYSSNCPDLHSLPPEGDGHHFGNDLPELSKLIEKGSHFGKNYVAVLKPILLDGEKMGTIYLQSDLKDFYSHLKWHAGAFAVIMLASSLVVLLLSSRFQRLISEPILFLAQTMKKVSEEKNYSIRVEKRSNDEVGILNDGFNEMLEQIQARDKKLEQHRMELEKQVSMRTAELSKSNQELERSNAELQQFAYIASHDLQEPLRMVTSYVQLLERRYKEKLDADAHDFIAYAVDGANRMQILINDLLAFSRVGTQGKDPELIDCETVLTRTLANLRIAIEESGAVVTHDPLPTVMADDMQLGQLFQNLISNAIKFHGKESPAVHISAKIQNPKSKISNVWVFSVSDNGIGIDPEYAERIFVIFQRLHGKAEYPGTGIGLAVCKKIVERHGEQIWVESEQGKGSAFYFTMRQKEK